MFIFDIMNTDSQLKISDFVKLSVNEKSDVLNASGVLIDNYQDSGNNIKVYYLSNFFVEVTSDSSKNNIKDFLPFRSGFKLNSPAL